MKDLALLTLRLVSGGLLAGHGAQKLFGWFGGHGLTGTRQMMNSLGVQPADGWAWAAGGSEFAGGVLTALGLFWPLGPTTVAAPMTIATGTVHWGKPIWATQGGAELPVTNLAVAAALAALGPGSLSLDRLLRIRLRRSLVLVAAAGTACGVGWVLTGQPRPGPSARPAPPAEAPRPVAAGQGPDSEG